jgi:TonB family protein
VRCTVADDGSCSDVKIVRGHPLFYAEVIENAKKWQFPASKGGGKPRTADIDYEFRIRGVRVPKDNADADVTFELPNVVIVTAPFDAKVPCRWPLLDR